MKEMIKNNVEVIVFGEGGDVELLNYRVENGKQVFDYKTKSVFRSSIKLEMAGSHNIENASVAMSIATMLGYDMEEVAKAMESFRGVKRRFEYVLKKPGCVIIDDYAHHPNELKAVIEGVKNVYEGKKYLEFFSHICLVEHLIFIKNSVKN